MTFEDATMFWHRCKDYWGSLTALDNYTSALLLPTHIHTPIHHTLSTDSYVTPAGETEWYMCMWRHGVGEEGHIACSWRITVDCQRYPSTLLKLFCPVMGNLFVSDTGSPKVLRCGNVEVRISITRQALYLFRRLV